MKRNKLMLFFILILTIMLSIYGCSSSSSRQELLTTHSVKGNLVSMGYHAADKLISNLKQPINSGDSIIVATFVNVDDLKKSSTFGRIIAEQIASRFSQRGYKVKEVKLSQDTIFVQGNEGEFLLSRDLKYISEKHNASAVVVGTYGNVYNKRYVSARVINPSNSLIISSCDFSLPIEFKETR